MVKVKVDGKIVELDKGMMVYQIMKRLGLNPEEYLPVKDGELVPEDEYIRDEDEIEFVRVTSKG